MYTQPLITVGEFAKLARTTKRTVLWYEENRVLLPTEVNAKGYRFYLPQQIIDFQVVLLLRKLHFSLDEIKKYIKQKYALKDLFKFKEAVLAGEVMALQKSLQDVGNFYKNLDTSGTLVSPTVRKVAPFEIYCIEKIGSFDRIKEYGQELQSHFLKLPTGATYLTLFFDTEYRPKKSRMKIGVVATKTMKLRPASENIVRREKIPGFIALSYTHQGPGSLLSMLWQELYRYTEKKGLQHKNNLPFIDLELYHKTSLNGEPNENKMVFELLLPIEK